MFCEKYKPELAIIQWTNLTRTEAIGHGAQTSQNEGWIQQLANTEDNKGKAQVYFLHNENLLFFVNNGSNWVKGKFWLRRELAILSICPIRNF